MSKAPEGVLGRHEDFWVECREGSVVFTFNRQFALNRGDTLTVSLEDFKFLDTSDYDTMRRYFEWRSGGALLEPPPGLFKRIWNYFFR